MLSPSLEDYLEEVYRLYLTTRTIRVKDIAEQLGFSMPSVVKGLKKLDELGYIQYKPYEEIEVLEKGKRRGLFLVERNRILREFICTIGAECDIRQEAEAMEHYLSLSTIKAIEKLVEFLRCDQVLLARFKQHSVVSVLDDNEMDLGRD